MRRTSLSVCPTTIASSDGGGRHLPHRVGSGLSGDAIALHTRARDQVAHSGPPRVTQDGPRPPVTGPGPSITTAPRTDAAITHPRTSSPPPLRGHAVSLAPGFELAAAVIEMLRQQQEMLRQQQERDREQREHDHELDREREDKGERTRIRERQLDRERAAEHDHVLIETSAGIKQLHKDMANSPRFSRRGTPISTPGPAADARAADDHPKPAPCKTPDGTCPTVPYQAADRHPGAEPTPPPRHVPGHTESSRARTSTVDPPAPHTAARRGLADSFRPLGPPPHPPREVAPPRSSPPPVARITTHPTSQCRPPPNLTPPP